MGENFYLLCIKFFAEVDQPAWAWVILGLGAVRVVAVHAPTLGAKPHSTPVVIRIVIKDTIASAM